ncbi:MAG: hypothetical protein ACRDM1_12170 [Gaiellaceae bacterium]
MRPRRLRWEMPEPPPPKHPYRDTLLVYGALAILIVLVALATGGGFARSVLIAVVFFVLASAWNAYRWRTRSRGRARERDEGEDAP